MNNTTNLSSLIWSSADDVLRNVFKPSEYGEVILPFVVMRRLDCVLEQKKDEVYNLFTQYKDKLSDWEILNTPTPYTIEGEVDRIHLEAIPSVVIEREGTNYIAIESSQHDSLVVWNPWQGAATMSDMDAFSYKQMVCVETTITQGKQLLPGEKCAMRQKVS